MDVCRIESEGNTYADNWDDYHKGASCWGSHGLFQLGCLHGLTLEESYNPILNIEKAYQLWKADGWNPWFNTMKKLALK